MNPNEPHVGTANPVHPGGHALPAVTESAEVPPNPSRNAGSELSVPLSFSEAIQGLQQGDFSRLAPLFGRSGVSVSPMVRWYDDGTFRSQPDALNEAFTCACFNGCVDVAEHLLSRGVAAAGGAATGLNALHWAVNRGQLEIARLLLRHQAPLEVRNCHGGTVLGCAVWSAVHETRPTHPAIIELLLESGADIGQAEYPCGDPRIDAILRRFGAT